jgi:hypothetical protein
MNQEKHTYFYGLQSRDHAIELATRVCNMLGLGANGLAINLLLETACVETCLGTYQDPTPNGAGWGLTQGDAIGVLDVAKRTRDVDARRIRHAFGFEIYNTIGPDLANNPLKAFVFTRCFYKLIPEAIPETLQGRAEYWKKYYNTHLGKGTVNEYIEKAERYLYDFHLHAGQQ